MVGTDSSEGDTSESDDGGDDVLSDPKRFVRSLHMFAKVRVCAREIFTETR
jgi:hypothetical protein